MKKDKQHFGWDESIQRRMGPRGFLVLHVSIKKENIR